MIALVGAGRGGGGGGDEEPGFLTVPWSPGIADRTGQIPGHAYRTMMVLVETFREVGMGDRIHEVDWGHIAFAVARGNALCHAVIAKLALELAAELEIVPQRRRS